MCWFFFLWGPKGEKRVRERERVNLSNLKLKEFIDYTGNGFASKSVMEGNEFLSHLLLYAFLWDTEKMTF